VIATGKGTNFIETAGITKLRHPFPRGQSIAAVLAGYFFLTAHGLGGGITLLQLGEEGFPAFSVITVGHRT
jgi:hypothetical protein